MKSKIRQILILLSILLITDYFFYILEARYGSISFIYILDYMIKSVLIFLLIITLLYKTYFNLSSSKFRVLICVVIPLLFSLHVSQRLIKIEKFYFYSKKLTKTNSGNLWQFSNELGHRSIPNSTGNYIYYIGDSIKGEVPVLFDSSGYRTVPDSLKISSDETDLYLGCSWTFGDNISAEETYPYITSKSLHHKYVNAGASGYGFGQMYQIASDLIPKNKFKYVFIQLSYWLSLRAMEMNGPTYYGYAPYPFFSDSENSFKLNPPSYKTLMFNGRKRNWRETKPSYVEKLYFEITDGSKIEMRDFYSYKWAEIKVKLGIIPEPTHNKNKLELYFYDKLIDLCKKYSAIPVILKLRYETKEGRNIKAYLSHKATVIDLDDAFDKLSNNDKGLFQKYFGMYHMHKKDSIWFDNHPNSRAHHLISNKICNSLYKGTD